MNSPPSTAAKGFGADVRRLLTGTSVAQIINIAAAPILTRLYSPEHYGVLALYVSTTVLLSLFSTLNYEAGVMLPRDRGEAWTLFLLSLGLSGVFSSILLAVSFIAPRAAGSMIPSSFLPYLPWVPAGVFLMAANRSLDMWLGRTLHYGLLAGGKVAGAGAGVLTRLGWVGALVATPGGLIAGSLLCEVAKVAWVIRRGPFAGMRSVRASWRACLVRYADFPRYQLWASLLEYGGTALPVFVMAHIFGTGMVGLYDLGFRMVFVPVELVVQSVRQVFYQRSVEEVRNTGSAARLVEDTGARLSALCVLPFLALALSGSLIFSLVFGPDWPRAGLYAQMLSPAFFLRCVITPVLVFTTLNRQDIYLAWQLCHFAVLGAALAAGGVTGSDLVAVACLSIGTCITHLVLAVLNCRVAGASLARSFILRRFA